MARIIEYIRAGDAYQVVPSQRWSAPVPVEAFSIYRGLRTVNPSPYMYFLDFGDFELAGASPEPLITVTGRRVSTRPVAGTRPRGASPEEDERIADELLADPKERAEHVMLVDLGRNDLGRVCEYGSVDVEQFMAVEHYSHVMHIVSSVAGRLREGVGALDALRSVLPAGTLSGAPKVRAMEIIDELEPVKRGGYGGAIGYASYTGDLDTCIHIRTVVVKDGVAHVQAGRRHGRRRPPGSGVPGVRGQGASGPASDRAGCRAAGVGVSVRVLVVDNYDSFTYNLVQYLGELGAELEVVRHDHATVADLLLRGYDRVIVSPGPCTPGRGGDLPGGGGALPAGGYPDARGLSRPPGAGAGVGRAASSGTNRCTARRPRSNTTAGRSSPGCRTRSRSGATTRWSPRRSSPRRWRRPRSAAAW